MWRSLVEWDVLEIYQAVKGVGTDEETLSEIIGWHYNERLADVKQHYKDLIKED